jgi:phage-related protein
VVRDVVFYGTDIIEFYESQNEKIRLKIGYVLDLIRKEPRVPIKFFKKLVSSEDIYEVRIITSQKSIRMLCFIENGNLIVLTNAFVKKTQKTPKKEIKLAEKLKKTILR